jgi:hypothetical protein
MKKTTVFAAFLFLLAGTAFAQSEKYQKKMLDLVSRIDSFNSGDALTDMANTFERVGDAEKTQWLPYYYAALSHLMAANMKTMGQQNAAITDVAADKADALLNKALALTKENSETWCVKKMIATMRMMGDPMNRWMQYGPIASEALGKAKELDAGNPRVYILEGQDKFYTPEQFGGSKTEAKVLFGKAKELFGTFKPETALHPSWGMGQVMYFLSQVQ